MSDLFLQFVDSLPKIYSERKAALERFQQWHQRASGAMKVARSQQTLSKNDAANRATLTMTWYRLRLLLTGLNKKFVATKKHAHPSGYHNQLSQRHAAPAAAKDDRQRLQMPQITARA